MYPPPPDLDAHHKSSLPRLVLRLPEAPKGKLTCRPFHEAAEVVLVRQTPIGSQGLSPLPCLRKPRSIITHDTKPSCLFAVGG